MFGLEFFEFSSQNDDHKEVAENYTDVLFYRESTLSSVIRFGKLGKDYDHEEVTGEIKYIIEYFDCHEKTVISANGCMFSPIRTRSGYEGM